MAETSAPIASAVILPDSAGSPYSKRRRSSAAESVTKRPRLSSDAQSQSPRDDDPTHPEAARRPSITQPTVPAQADKRKASVQEERKRGQRLFGGLLSTLSQTAPNNQNKRRQEIEKKQQERAKQQKVADQEKKREKLANLKVVRQEEQIKFEERSMRTKHTNMRAMANFLSTTTGPKLYYKPWELVPEQEDQISHQKATTKTQTEQEATEFYERHPHLTPPPTVHKEDSGQANSHSDTEPVGKSNTDEKKTSPSHSTPAIEPADVDDASTNSHPPDSPSKSRTSVDAHREEHNGEILVENDEDAVIY